MEKIASAHQKNILHGSTKASNFAAAYGWISNMPEKRKRLAVNHSLNFEDPGSGVRTSTIESARQKFRQRQQKEIWNLRITSCIAY